MPFLTKVRCVLLLHTLADDDLMGTVALAPQRLRHGEVRLANR